MFPLVLPGRARPRRHGRRLLWESLEARLVLSGILYTDPAPGSILTRSPEAYRVAFDTTLADYSFGLADIAVDRIGADGSVSRAFTDFDLPFQTLDDSGTTLVYSLNAALNPGVYRLVLAGDSFLESLDGTFLGPADGMDQVLSEFTIAQPGLTRADAQDLGVVGSSVVSTGDALDFAATPGDVRLYKFSLAKGHFWRVGLEVEAERLGSSLNAAITLFDASGQVIASNDVGRADAPGDPFLFQGLEAGDYYVGVSGTGNLGGRDGGYDIATGATGTGMDSPGGLFTLNLVADEADVPSALIAFRVHHADPLDSTPTGFTMRFSSPLDLGRSGSEVLSSATNGLELVDARGEVWPISVVNYHEAQGVIQFLFWDRLPEGVYTIRLSATSPLVDLAGRSPTSPRMPSGVLATFAVSPDTRVRQKDGSLSFDSSAVPAGNGRTQVVRAEDLGPLVPDMPLNGLSRSLTLQPGQSAVYRFVNLYDDNFQFLLESQGGSLRADLVGGGTTQTFLLDASPDVYQEAFLAKMGVAEYFLRISATGEAPVTFRSTIHIPAYSWDSLLANGIGQGPALNLRLSAPETSPTWTTTTASALVGAGAIALAPAGPTAGPLAPGAYPTDGFGTYGNGPTPSGLAPSWPEFQPSANLSSGELAFGLLPDFSTAFVGRPNLQADHVGAIGPESISNAVALAAGNSAMIRGSGGSPGRSFSPSPRGRIVIIPEAQAQDAAPRGETASPTETGAEPEANLPQASEHAASSADFSVEPTAAVPTIATAAVEVMPTETAADPASETAEVDEEEALVPPSMTKPALVGLVGLSGLALHHAIRKWWSRRSPSLYRKQTPAPHSFSRRVRA